MAAPRIQALILCLTLASAKVIALPVGFVDAEDTTLDFNNNLEWLDLSVTESVFAFDGAFQISQALASGDQLAQDGWRIANTNEFASMAESFFGLEIDNGGYFTGDTIVVDPFEIDGTPSKDIEALIYQFIDIFGLRYPAATGFPLVFGGYLIIDEPGFLELFNAGTGFEWYAGFGIDWGGISGEADVIQVDFASAYENVGGGTYLVRSIPEPSVTLLILLGIASLSSVRFIRRHQ